MEVEVGVPEFVRFEVVAVSICVRSDAGEEVTDLGVVAEADWLRRVESWSPDTHTLVPSDLLAQSFDVSTSSAVTWNEVTHKMFALRLGAGRPPAGAVNYGAGGVTVISQMTSSPGLPPSMSRRWSVRLGRRNRFGIVLVAGSAW